MERGTDGRLERLRTFDLESYEDFCVGARGWLFKKLMPRAAGRVREIATSLGLSENAELDAGTLRQVFGADPVVGLSTRCAMSVQHMTWHALDREYKSNQQLYLRALAEADVSGPGTVELNPDQLVPDYARHEIHQQPGGYVGSDAAGWVYHHGTNGFYSGQNNQDELHRALAARVEPPRTGDVHTILDIGCGAGQLTVALKERFDGAEVLGLDISGPMVRYAHRRAVDLEVDVHFVQRPAEATGFADAKFDIVSAYILFHELPAEISRRVISEVARLLRPGGIFHIFDFKTNQGGVPPFIQYLRWVDQKYNSEIWSDHYHHLDLIQVLSDSHFSVEDLGPLHMGVHGYRATKLTQ